MIIGFVRHGKTEWNALGKIQGQTDIPLNEEGIAQARRLAARLSADERRWDAVISSDLRRAQATAAIIADKLGTRLLPPDKRLRERYFGEAEGTTEAERLARWGEKWRQMETGMESDADVRKRGTAFLREWLERHPDRNLLIVSHGSFLAQMFVELCGSMGDQHLGNMSYTVLSFEDGKWSPLLYNCTRHLD